MALKIAAWNVNSILARLPTALKVFEDVGADIWCLQEIKCEDPRFPRLEFEAMGYNIETFGQKSYNGVAILSKYRIEEFTRGIPGLEHEHSRYIEAVIAAPGGPVRVASIYAPNGNPIGTEKFAYKLAWMERLRAHAAALLDLDQPVVLGGDYNVIPAPEDCHDPKAWAGDALFQPESRRAFRALLHLGYTEAFRALHPDERGAYSFWDYQGGAFQLDHGIRIDHLLLSPQAADRLVACAIDKAPRRQPKASDHTPVTVTLQD